MKKYAIIGIIVGLIPTYVFGASARYNQLIEKKQRKMQELEKCTGNVNAWKIAGISTTGLTAVGVAGNVVLAKQRGDLDKSIQNTTNQISTTKDKIAELKAKKQKSGPGETEQTPATEYDNTGQTLTDEQMEELCTWVAYHSEWLEDNLFGDNAFQELSDHYYEDEEEWDEETREYVTKGSKPVYGFSNDVDEFYPDYSNYDPSTHTCTRIYVDKETRYAGVACIKFPEIEVVKVADSTASEEYEADNEWSIDDKVFTLNFEEDDGSYWVGNKMRLDANGNAIVNYIKANAEYCIKTSGSH